MNTIARTENRTENTASPIWQEHMTELIAFCREHPNIRIDSRRITIPREVRTEFYTLVDLLADSLIDGKAHLPTDIDILMDAFRELEGGFRHQTNIERFVMPHSLRAFITAPAESLRMHLYDPLMRVLQGRLPVDAFGMVADEVLGTRIEGLYQAARELLIYYQVLWKLDPVAVRKVSFDKDHALQSEPSILIEPGQQQAFAQRRIPDTLIQMRDGIWYATKAELASEVGYYDIPILRRRDNTLAGDSQPLIGHRLMMIYRLDSERSIPLIADRDTRHVAPPTVVVELSEPQALSVAAYRLALGNRAVTLHPLNGYYVVLPAGSATDGWFDADIPDIEHPPPVNFITLDSGLDSSFDCPFDIVAALRFKTQQTALDGRGINAVA
jgi:hypothetical protein